MSRQTASPIILETRTEQILAADVLQIFAAAQWTKHRSADQVQRMLAHTPHAVLAKMDGQPVGFARLVTDEVFRGFIEDVIVLPHLQKQDIGRRMVEALEAIARRLELPRVELTTTQMAFWERLGYVQKVGSTYMVKSLRERSGEWTAR